MVYKFYNVGTSTSMEIELFNKDNQPEELSDSVEFAMIKSNENTTLSVFLSKQDIFRLIGALHMLHKEMK